MVIAVARLRSELKDAILNGIKVDRDGTTVVMDPFKGDVTPEQADALVAYIRTFGVKKAKKTHVPDAGVVAPAPSPEQR